MKIEIETSATGYLDRYLSRVNYIKPFINKNDKEPFVDGKIIFYNSEEKSNKDYAGYFDIQIKGKSSNETNVKDEINYSVRVEDLKTYQINGGCVYFVVLINENPEKDIGYFVILTSIKIKEYLEKKNATTVNINLKRLPKDTKTFANLLYEGYGECQIQKRFKPAIRINDIQNKIKDGYNIISFANFNIENDKSFIFDYQHPIYLKKGKDILQVLGSNKIESITKHINYSVYVDDNKYYDSYDCIDENKEYNEVKFGKALTYKIGKEKTDVIVSFNVNNYALDEYILDSEFIISLFNKKKITINNGNKIFEIPFDYDETQSTIDIETIKKRLNFAKETKQLLEVLEINEDEKLDVSKITKADNYWLDIAIKSILYNERVVIKELYTYNPFMYLTVGNIHLLVYVEKNDDGYRLYKMSNRNYKMELRFDDSTRNRNVSCYYGFTIEDYKKISNLSFEDLYNSYIEIGNIDDINNCVIKLISAFDDCKKDKLLDVALNLIDWALKNFTNENMMHFLKMNRLQIALRKGIELTFIEKDYLNSILYNTQSDNYLKLGASLLLKNKEKTDILFNELNEEEQKEFKQMPIYKLYYN